MEKASSIRSEAVGAGDATGVIFATLPQLATEAEGSGGSQSRQGAGNGGRGRRGCLSPHSRIRQAPTTRVKIWSIWRVISELLKPYIRIVDDILYKE